MIAYTRPARIIHWLTFGLIVVMFGLGLSMTRLEFSDFKVRVYSVHEWIGLTVWMLTALRLIWRWRNPPPPPVPMARIQHLAAGAVHVLLYVVLFALPISGWMMSSAFAFPVVYLGLIPLPDLVPADRELAARLQRVHFTLAMALAGLFTMHAGAALYHHLIRRDDTLRRMWPGLGRR
jgi:cytochrome b561